MYIDKVPVDQIAVALQEIDDILLLETKTFDEKKFEEKVCPRFTFTELDKILDNLPDGKATGYDRVPNELLKNSSFDFKQYLLEFYNKIISEGAVPELLNRGKCMLIYKVKFEYYEKCQKTEGNLISGREFFRSITVSSNHNSK